MSTEKPLKGIATSCENFAGEGKGHDNQRGAQQNTDVLDRLDSAATAAASRVENNNIDVEMDSDNESNQNNETEKDSESTIKQFKTRKLSWKRRRVEHLKKARAARFQNKSGSSQDTHQGTCEESAALGKIEAPEENGIVQKVEKPLTDVPEKLPRVEEPKVAEERHIRRQSSQASDRTSASQASTRNDDNKRLLRQKAARYVLPPLLEQNFKTLKVYGFSLRQRTFFKNAIMRYGKPTETDILEKWKVESLASKADIEVKKYLDLFMKNLEEIPGEGEDTYKNGVPRDGINRINVLTRIGKMKLIRNKVQEYMIYMGPVSMPCGLELVINDDNPVSSGPLIALPNRRDPRPDIYFMIADGIHVGLHNIWREEDASSRGLEYEVWNRRHDYWLLAGVEEHGYGHFREICSDLRLNLLNIPFIRDGINEENKLCWMNSRFQVLEHALFVEAQFRICSYLFSKGVLSKSIVKAEEVLSLVERLSSIENIAICAALHGENDQEDDVMAFLKLLATLSPIRGRGFGMTTDQMITRLFPNCEAEKNISPTPKENCETLPKRNPFESLPNLPSPFELQVDMLEWTPSGSAHLLALIEEAVQEKRIPSSSA